MLDGTDTLVPLPARVALLTAFILLSGRDAAITRQAASRFLWPDAPDAFANLRQLLNRFAKTQSASGIDFLRYDHVNIFLNLPANPIDLLQLRTALSGLTWENCEATLALFGGDLLAEVTVPESDAAAWLVIRRERVHQDLFDAFAELIEGPGARANPQTVKAIASRLLEIDPYQEPPYRALMRAFAATGQMDRVFDTYRRCHDVIVGDLHSRIGPATTQLFTELTRHALQTEAVPAAAAGPRPRSMDLRAALPRLIILPPVPSDAVDPALVSVATLILEDTQAGLWNLRTVHMLAPHTAWALTGRLDEAAVRQYNIGYQLRTALHKRDRTNLLSVTLSDTNTLDIHWTAMYPLRRQDLADAHRQLSVAITASLADAVERAEMQRFESQPKSNAYYAYLMGQKNLRYMDLPHVRRADKAFRTAMAADPEFAPAFSGAARATQRQWLVLGRGDPELLDEAEAIGTRAVHLDHRDARGYRELALCSLYRRRWDDSIAHFTEAERLAPQHADMISDFGDALGHAGEPEAGLKKVERAMELNPIPPDQYWWNAAGLHFQLHEYRKAIADIDQMGDPLPALRIAAAAWAYLGDDDKARKIATRFLKEYPDFLIDHWLSIVPDRRPEDQRHYEHGLRRAGFR